MSDLAGKTIKGYEFRERVAAGGFGEIYRAFQSSVGREVAIKVILPRFANQTEFIRRFDAEAHMVARLEHPHIVPLYDYWRGPDGAYLVMRWLPEGNLRKRLENGRFDVNQVAKMLRQITSALSAAHHQGVIHRDIKPGNIMMDSEGNYYLSDFGIAKDITDGNTEGMTGSGIIGTPTYLSPEQAKGEKVTSQSDIYNLGILLYELLTGEHPFAGEDAVAIIMHHITDPLPSLKDRRPDLPKKLDTVIRKSTVKSAKKRYKSAKEVSSAFLDAMRGKLDEDELFVLPLTVDSLNPYKGLRAFQEADGDDFFGREALITQLVAELKPSIKKSRFLALVGPSGSGKSSVVKAGLLPQIRAGAISGSEKWFIAEMQPGSHPLDELEIALLSVSPGQIANVREQLERDERGLVRVAQLLLPKDVTNLLLLIDQFEELFTQVDNKADQKHFLKLLISAATDKRSRVRLLLTLRADFYDKPLMFPKFSELMRDRTSVIIPLTADELTRAVVQPAKRADVEIDGDLVTEIVSDVVEQPGALPLLQYALTELFEKRQNGTINKLTYQSIGGVLGALGKRAEDIQDSLSEEGQEISRQVFLRLVALGEGTGDTRRRVLRTELDGLSVNPEQLDEVISAFGNARLLTFDRDPITRSPTVEVAHEALLREWSHLRDWLDVSRADVSTQRRIAVASNEWKASNEDASFLLSGSRLDQFELWEKDTDIALTEQEKAFMVASLTERRAKRAKEKQRKAREKALEARARKVLQGLVGVLLLGVVVSVWFGVQANQAEQEALQSEQDARQAEQQALESEDAAIAAEQEALKQAAILLGAQAETEVEKDNTELALLLALEALENYPYTSQAEHALGQAVTQNRVLLLMSEHKGAVTGVAWSPDGTRLASAGVENKVRIWDAVSGEQQLIIQLPETTGRTFDMALSVIWSPDGQQLLTVSGDRFLIGSQDYVMILWDAATGEQIHSFSPPNTTEVDVETAGGTISGLNFATGNAAGFAPQSGRLATIGGDNTAVVWNSSLETRLVTLSGHENDVNSVTWSPDESRIASTSEDGTARIWDAAAGEVLFTLGEHEGGVNSAAWSPDGLRLVTSGDDGTARIWDATTGEMLTVIQADELIVWSAGWSPDGIRVVTGSQDATVRFWDAETGRELVVLRGHRSWITHLAWSTQGDRIATASFDGEIRIWNAASSTALMTFPQFAPSSSDFSWSPAGDQIVIPYDKTFDSSFNFIEIPDSGELVIIDSQTGNTHVITSGWSSSAQATFSPDGNYILGRVTMYDPETFYDHEDEQTVFIFDAATGELVQELYSPDIELFLRDVDWSADGSQVLAGDTQGQAYIWDSATGKLVRQFTANDDMVIAVAWSPDGTKYATGGSSSFVKIWDAITGEVIFELEAAERPANVLALTWSPDGKRLLSVSGNASVGALDNTARIWDAATGEQLLLIDAHADTVWWGAWSPDGTRIVTTSFDNTTRVWDASTGAELLSLDTPGAWGTYAEWSPDGTRLFTAGFVSAISPSIWRVWQSTEELIEYAKECCVLRELTREEREQFGLPLNNIEE